MMALMKQATAACFLLVAAAVSARAVAPAQVPEVDGATAVSAVALMGGALVVLRSRTRK